MTTEARAEIDRLTTMHRNAVEALNNVTAELLKAKQEIERLKEVISDLHSVVDKAGWDELEEETQQAALAIHEELWHG
jgi:uncharacterized coiled-coil DUF342 family protein